MVETSSDLRSKARQVLIEAFRMVSTDEYDRDIQEAVTDDLVDALLSIAWDHQFDTDLATLRSKARRYIRETAEAGSDED